MANLSQCIRCESEFQAGTASRNQKYCSADCRTRWWNEKRHTGATRGKWQEDRYGPAPVYNYSEVERAWLAAIIDGEGTIGIYRSVRKGNKSGYRYQAVCSFANTNEKLVERFSELVRTTAAKKRTNGPGCKPILAVTVKGRALKGFLQEIYPYLIAKQAQAKVVLQFIQALEGSSMRTSSSHEMFHGFYARTIELNRKGVFS